MFDQSGDVRYVWIGLSLLGAALIGIVAHRLVSPQPDAAGPANTVDAVARDRHVEMGSRAGTRSGTYPLSADAVRIESHRIGVRFDGVATYETLAYGPVTPVREGTLLWEVLQGARPEHVFETPDEFTTAAERARERDPIWRPSPDRLSVRTVAWEGTDATLAGA